jgi:cyclopropane-fatty-acyl-phospholipid synthase
MHCGHRGKSHVHSPKCDGQSSRVCGHCINGDRPWDILLHDERFFSRVLASGTLGFGESYMEGWWDCDALDEMCCHAIRAGVEKRFAFRLPNSLALLTALLANQQTLWRSRKVGRVHYDLSNDFFEAMLDPNMQYSCALFAEDDGLASAQLRKLDWICERLRLRPGLRLLDIGCGWVDWPATPPATTVARQSG